MPRLCSVHRALRAGLLLAACGGNERPAADAGCWPLSDSPSAQIGTGDVTFEPLPDVLPVIINASQGDPYLQVHVRIHGIPPGDPQDTLASGNPKTMGSVVIPELGRTLGADRPPATFGYTCSPEPGAYDLARSLHIGFGFGDNPLDQVSGKQARITVEVIGSNGLSARDEKLVTLMVMSGAAPGAGAPITVGGSP
jgi:hypothetical protein